jgi:hypothetical protein
MIWEVFEEERGKLVDYRGPFDGFHPVPASVSKTCTVCPASAPIGQIGVNEQERISGPS